MQQNVQNIRAQRQQMQEQLTELNSALTELKTTDKAYKIVGKIMLATSKTDLNKDLSEKKELMEVRLKNFSQQEKKLEGSMEDLQKEVMKELNENKDTK